MTVFAGRFGRALGMLAVMGLLVSGGASAQAGKQATDKLRVYFIDVEGGQATLFVTPAGQSLLIDTGWPGNSYRDADRIAAAAKLAGLKRIDYVLITHFHVDHVGGVPQLVERIPVGTFIDHGPNRELDKGVTEHGYAEYQKVLKAGKYKHIVARPGKTLPIAGMKATVISADGNLIRKALPGAGEANPFCKSSEARPADVTENGRSVGVEISFGRLRLLDLGDLTWDKEMELVCPVDKVGHVDVYVVSHHGWYQSSSPALVDALHARVAIMDNGEKKGGSMPTLQSIAKAPGLETLWQLHFSDEGGDANTAEEYIANPQGTDDGNFIELSGASDGSFDVLNSRTNATKHYAAMR
jgi:beta-lactamase superfamily II metal-dependent hydrolase